MSTNKTMKNKLVNSMRATKAGSTENVVEAKKEEAPVASKPAPVASKPTPATKKSTPRKKAAPVSTGYISSNRVWPD